MDEAFSSAVNEYSSQIRSFSSQTNSDELRIWNEQTQLASTNLRTALDQRQDTATGDAYIDTVDKILSKALIDLKLADVLYEVAQGKPLVESDVTLGADFSFEEELQVLEATTLPPVKLDTLLKLKANGIEAARPELITQVETFSGHVVSNTARTCAEIARSITISFILGDLVSGVLQPDEVTQQALDFAEDGIESVLDLAAGETEAEPEKQNRLQMLLNGDFLESHFEDYYQTPALEIKLSGVIQRSSRDLQQFNTVSDNLGVLLQRYRDHETRLHKVVTMVGRFSRWAGPFSRLITPATKLNFGRQVIHLGSEYLDSWRDKANKIAGLGSLIENGLAQ